MKGKADAQLKQIEAEETRNFIRGQLKEAILDDDYKRQQMVANILRRDRGDNRTSWIRPVTAVLALVFWLALTLSQIELGGNGILPIIWNVPPGKLGALFLGFPMGVLATFYIARPFEKFLIGRTQL
jgi:hypothetical protein